MNNWSTAQHKGTIPTQTLPLCYLLLLVAVSCSYYNAQNGLDPQQLALMVYIQPSHSTKTSLALEPTRTICTGDVPLVLTSAFTNVHTWLTTMLLSPTATCTGGSSTNQALILPICTHTKEQMLQLALVVEGVHHYHWNSQYLPGPWSCHDLITKLAIDLSANPFTDLLSHPINNHSISPCLHDSKTSQFDLRSFSPLKLLLKITLMANFH